MLSRILCTWVAVGMVGCIQIGSSPQPAAVTGAGEVAFELAGKGGAAIVVPVRINDTGPYSFIVDTGATVTCVDQPLIEELKLPRPPGVVGYGATVGQSGTVGVHRIDTLQVGDATASGLTACALDLSGMKAVGLDAQGLLGLNFLKSFIVTFDFTRNVMTLQAPRTRARR
jgi:predicted aspartyl protease